MGNLRNCLWPIDDCGSIQSRLQNACMLALLLWIALINAFLARVSLFLEGVQHAKSSNEAQNSSCQTQ